MTKKKILFLSYNDFLGGAAIATYNIFQTIPDDKFEKKFYCINKITNDEKVKKIKLNYIRYIKIAFFILVSKILFFAFRTNNKIKRSLCIFRTGVLDETNYDDFDVLHVHWFFNDLISLDEILTFKKKIIISTHDLWFCNGTLHYDDNKLNKFTKYFENKILKIKLKKILENNSNIILTTPSEWSKKKLLNTFKIYNNKGLKIPDIHIIKNPVKKKTNEDKIELRRRFLLPPNEQICLFHYEKNNDYIKGYDILHDVLKKIDEKVILKYFIIFGNNTKFFPTHRYPNLIFYDYGFVNYEKIHNLYQVSDYFILTSRQETFSQLTAESISNNLPVITFFDTAQAELVKHKENGYLCEKNNYSDFIDGIEFFKKNKFYKTKDFDKLYSEEYFNKYLSVLYE